MIEGYLFKSDDSCFFDIAFPKLMLGNNFLSIQKTIINYQLNMI